MGEYREFGGVWQSMDGGGVGAFLVGWELGQVWGEYGRSGEGVKRGVEKCGGRCGEVFWSVGKVRGDVGVSRC